MQRAAASTPTSQPAQTPSTEPATKRRRIDSATSSPALSTPGTPNTESNFIPQFAPLAQILRRVGTSTFDRGEGADTEWVLDLKLKIPGEVKAQSRNDSTKGSIKANGISGIPGLGNTEPDESEAEEEEAGEEDIWQHQPSGRQTYGSFRQKSKHVTTPQDQTGADNEADLSSGSGSDPDSDSNVDSDEEMRQVRKAMEQKHDRMGAGAGSSRGGKNRGRGGGPSKTGKRRREESSYKAKKKARKLESENNSTRAKMYDFVPENGVRW